MSAGTTIPADTPGIGAEQIALLEKLSNACAISGDEQQVRKIVLEEIKGHADEVKVDALGNVLAVKKAKTSEPLRVMLDAHMDEIGFMIVEDNKDGLFSFESVGGIDVRVLPGKTVLVGKENVPGVIGAKPIHLTEHGETENKIPIESLRIDVGLNGGGKVKVGDRAAFATRFRQVGPSLFGKALDNRLGVATLIELLKHSPENVELLVAFTVQEEIGLRGARVAAYAFNPDLAIAVDSTPAYDLPVWEETENSGYNTRLGARPGDLHRRRGHALRPAPDPPPGANGRGAGHPVPVPPARRRRHGCRGDPPRAQRGAGGIRLGAGALRAHGADGGAHGGLGAYPGAGLPRDRAPGALPAGRGALSEPQILGIWGCEAPPYTQNLDIFFSLEHVDEEINPEAG